MWIAKETGRIKCEAMHSSTCGLPTGTMARLVDRMLCDQAVMGSMLWVPI